MPWKLIEVGDYDEHALTDEELALLGYVVEKASKKTEKGSFLGRLLQSITRKINGDVLDAVKRANI